MNDHMDGHLRQAAEIAGSHLNASYGSAAAPAAAGLVAQVATAVALTRIADHLEGPKRAAGWRNL